MCYAQKEYLEPIKDYDNFVDKSLKNFHDQLFLKLYEGFAKMPLARYTATSSNTGEYAFSVESVNNIYFIVSNTLSESYWFSNYRNNINLITSRKEIGNKLGIKIGELFQMLVFQSKRKDSVFWYPDTMIYYFSALNKDGQIVTGETSSSDCKGLLGRLVKVCDNLYKMGNGENISQANMILEVEELIQNFRANNQDK